MGKVEALASVTTQRQTIIMLLFTAPSGVIHRMFICHATEGH